MSLQSPSPIEIAYSLNVFTVLSNDKDVILGFPDFPPLGYTAINLLKTAMKSLEKLNSIRINGKRIWKDSFDIDCFTEFECGGYGEPQRLGKNGGYFQAVVDLLRISPFEPVDDDADAVEDDDSVFDRFGLDNDADGFFDDGVGSEGAGKRKYLRKVGSLLF
ncbi:hypothetical protein BDR26DRAFT_927201 [Obelidium mucronatum]|nr:hypothetical protein BDR26DRAFT_927201 [Obelidium mucronatum]